MEKLKPQPANLSPIVKILISGPLPGKVDPEKPNIITPVYPINILLESKEIFSITLAGFPAPTEEVAREIWNKNQSQFEKSVTPTK